MVAIADYLLLILLRICTRQFGIV
jgi:hypothetical protein